MAVQTQLCLNYGIAENIRIAKSNQMIDHDLYFKLIPT